MGKEHFFEVLTITGGEKGLWEQSKKIVSDELTKAEATLTEAAKSYLDASDRMNKKTDDPENFMSFVLTRETLLAVRFRVFQQVITYLQVYPELGKSERFHRLFDLTVPDDEGFRKEADLLLEITAKSSFLVDYLQKKVKDKSAEVQEMEKELEKNKARINDLRADRDKAIYEKEKLIRERSGRQNLTVKRTAAIWHVNEKTIRNWDKGIGTPPEYPGRNVTRVESEACYNMYIHRINMNNTDYKSLKNKGGSNYLSNR